MGAFEDSTDGIFKRKHESSAHVIAAEEGVLVTEPDGHELHRALKARHITMIGILQSFTQLHKVQLQSRQADE
jgi:amino acid permease